MLGVIKPQIRNSIAYLLPQPDKKKTTTAVVKRDKRSGLDRNDLKTDLVCSTDFLSEKVQ